MAVNSQWDGFSTCNQLQFKVGCSKNNLDHISFGADSLSRPVYYYKIGVCIRIRIKVWGNVPVNWPKLLGPFQNVLPPFFDVYVLECHSTLLPVQSRDINFFKLCFRAI